MLIGARPHAEVYEARDGAAALATARARNDLDVVFLDLGLPGASGLATLQTLARLRPTLPVIVVSATEDPDQVREAFAAGALGYVPKSASSETLLTALDLVLRGELFVPSLVLRRAPPPPAPAATANPGERLTERQAEVLKWLGQGLSNKAIARQMAVSEKTVKAHMTAVFRALSVEGRAQAVRAARSAGLI